LNTRRKTAHSISYEIIRQNETAGSWIIMVPGFSLDSHYFCEQVKQLQENYNLLLTDLRGHGSSFEASGPYGIEEYADDILQVLDEAGIEKTHYWGTHTGAAVGLLIALRQPERLMSLVLEGATLPGFPMPRTAELLERGKSMARNEGLDKALQDWFENADWFASINNSPLECRAEEMNAMIRRFKGAPWLCNVPGRELTPVVDHINKITHPVLLYNGEADLTDFKKVAYKLNSEFLHVQFAEIPKTGGFPAWENPQYVNTLVNDFLSKNALSGHTG
jgi:pimeloyl-ACP methyl ester carboxylesterase